MSQILAAPRRWPFRTAVLLAAAVVVIGVVVTVRGWLQTAGPDGAVRGYFAALRDDDAATALAYGTVPPGSRALLSDRVLARQQQIAPIDDVRITDVTTDGDRARVGVRYTLGFDGGARVTTATIDVHRDDGWRLDRSAVVTQLVVSVASQRATLDGAAVPSGSTLVFPGAAPVNFDTPYLQLDPASGSISPNAQTSTRLDPQITPAGRTTVIAAARRLLTGCLTSSNDLRCALPDERYVPGSVRGQVTGDLSKELTVGIAADSVGEFTIDGDVQVHGRYQRLEFDNTVTSKTDTTFTLSVNLRGYATSPLVLRWETPT